MGGRADVRRSFDRVELEQNLAALKSWNSNFEVPDVIHFSDFVYDRRVLAQSMLLGQRAPEWGHASHFPYPNGAKLRDLIVLLPLDLALIRAGAGRIAQHVEQRLSDRAYGYHTIGGGAA